MINRMAYRAQWKDGMEEAGTDNLREQIPAVKALADAGRIMTLSAYRWQKNVFLYCECIDCEIHPDELFPAAGSLLEEWPGKAEKRKWIPMVDVFHFNEPVSVEHWKRKSPVEKRVGMVAHLRPEMIASYIYYHYQLQEERAFLGDKYELISLHENLLFGYLERPEIVEEPLTPKKLNTSGTPANWLDSRMDLHFIPWEDGDPYFKDIELIFSV
jgi:L-rhamnose mutarotase